MNEDLKQIKEDLKFIKKEIRYSSFDTIYTSFLVLVLSIIISIIMTQGIEGFSSGLANGAVIFFGLFFIASFVFQLCSLYDIKLKRWSVLLIFYSSLSALISVNDKLIIPSWIVTLIAYILGVSGFVIIHIYFNNLED